MPAQQQKRNRLTPWYIGMAIVLAAIGFTFYRLMTNQCAEPAVEYAVLLVVPAVYLALMYLTFTSQQ